MKTREQINKEYSHHCLEKGDKSNRRALHYQELLKLDHEIEELEKKALLIMVEKACDEQPKVENPVAKVEKSA